jgi:DNA repair protein REV1
MYKDVTKSRGQTELNFKPMKPITSDFNVPDSDEEQNNSFEQTPPSSETEDDESVIDAKHPKFLETYLKRSRLHYLSSTAIAKKVYVQDLRQKIEHHHIIEKHREELKIKLQRTERDYLFQLNEQEKLYMHIDMDCFFVSVATRNQPELRDQPIVITHSRGKKSNMITTEQQFFSRSELASCNYAARQYGIRNGMYLGKAQELCAKHQAKLLCLPYDYEGFHEVSDRFYDTILSYTLDVEAVSCDEMYVDLTELISYFKPLHPLTFVSLLREEIEINTKCPCSAGIGSNMLLARLATRQAKPNGEYYIERGYEQEFISKQKILDLPGIGLSILDKLKQISSHNTIETCKHIQNLFSLEQLKNILGKKQGQIIYDMSRGIDIRILNKDYRPKSISIDINYGIRFQTFDELIIFIKQLVMELHKRLKQAKQKGKQLTVKIRVRSVNAPIEPEKFMGCGQTDDSSRLVNLHSYTDDPVIIETETIKLLKQLNFIVADLRGVRENRKMIKQKFFCCYLDWNFNDTISISN